MAMILCPTHGASPVKFVCAHLNGDFAAERPIRSSRLIYVLLRGVDPPDNLWFSTLFCDDCLSSLNIPNATDTLYDDDVEAHYQQLIRYQPYLLCLHCFRQ